MDFSENWFLLALISTFFYGVHSFLYKKLTEDSGDTGTVQIVFPAVVTLAAIPATIWEEARFGNDFALTILIASLQGILFYIATQSRLEALETKLPAHELFPIVKTSAPLIVIISALIFDEWETLNEPKRLIGVVLAISATYLLLHWRAGALFILNRGVALALVSMFASTGAALAAKFVFVSEGEINIFGFILISNTVNLMLATGKLALSKNKVTKTHFKTGFRAGIIIGILNFLGFASFLMAIKYGDLSLVASINSLYILFPVVLSALYYGEVLTPRKQVAIVLSIVAIMLIK